MTEQDIGPIDYLTLEFPKAKLTGEGLAALIDLVDRGIIRILDLRFIKREDDGSFTALAVSDFDGDGTLDLAIFEGVDCLAFPSMALGACGWVAGTANMIPELAVELWRLTHVAQDLPAARALHERIDPLHLLSREAGIYFALGKEVCRLRGIPLGAVRLPWPELSDDQRRRAHELARSLGLVTAAGGRLA